MRIAKGRWRGRQFRLSSLDRHTRPTSNYAKEGLFNILEHNYRIVESSALDLFAGIGSIGLEFLSLGAAHVSMVERSVSQCAFLKRVSGELGLSSEEIRIINMDVFRYLEAESARQFDFIFADPPFSSWYAEEIAERIIKNKLLKKEGIFIYEMEKKKNNNISKYKPVRAVVYGDIQFLFFDSAALRI